MAKYNLKSATVSFQGTTVTCLTNMETSWSSNVTKEQCHDASAAVSIVGDASYTVTLNGLLDDANDATIINLFQPDDSGAFSATLSSGTVISATNAVVGDGGASFPTNGFAAFNVTLELDDYSAV